MLPDRVSNPGPLTYESGALPIALRGPAVILSKTIMAYTANEHIMLIKCSFALYSSVVYFQWGNVP